MKLVEMSWSELKLIQVNKLEFTDKKNNALMTPLAIKPKFQGLWFFLKSAKRPNWASAHEQSAWAH